MGKGSVARPLSVPKQEFGKKYDETFKNGLAELWLWLNRNVRVEKKGK